MVDLASTMRTRLRRAGPALERLSRSRWSWLALAIVVVFADYLTGPVVQFPAVLLAPVALAARHGSALNGVVLAVTLPVVRTLLMRTLASPSVHASVVNTTIHAAVFLVVAALVRQAAQKRAALEEVRVLRRLLPICCFCKRIRNSADAWDPIEKYMSEHSEATFTHGLCDECAREHYGFDPHAEKAERASHRRPPG